jgi:phosphoenolpyruvate synthase/pyruvate phosphate dikinase
MLVGEPRKFIRIDGIEREIKDRKNDIEFYKPVIKHFVLNLNRELYEKEIPIRLAIEQTNENNYAHLTDEDRKTIKRLKEEIEKESISIRNFFSLT